MAYLYCQEIEEYDWEEILIKGMEYKAGLGKICQHEEFSYDILWT